MTETSFKNDEYNELLDSVNNDTPSDEDVIGAGQNIYDAVMKKADELIRKRNELHNDNPGLPREYGTTGTGTGEGMSDEQHEDIKSRIIWVIDRYRDACAPFPRDFTSGLIEPMEKIASSLDSSRDVNAAPDSGAIYTAKENLADWHGHLKNQFVENFLGPLPAILEHHALVAHHLALHANAMRALYVRQRHEAIEISKKAVEAVEAINDSKGADILKLLGILVALGTVVSAAGAPLGITLTAAALAGASSGAGPFVETGDELQLGADTIEGVLDNLSDALDANEKRTEDEADTIIEALHRTGESLYAHVTAGRTGKDASENPLVPIDPDLSDADATERHNELAMYWN